jgi:peptidoglycan/LPS O-acetylase OafA/YrhL
MENNNRVQYIDTWRFFAIALVIVSHIIEFSHPFYKEALPGLIWRIHPLGRLGVHVFFCISGYVICRGMLNESRMYGSLSLRNFYIRRVFRILPPLALYLLFIAAMVQLGMFETMPAQFAQAAAFLCNVEYLGDCGWYFGHTWSLAFEEQFYLVFPLLFSALGLARKRGKLLVLAVVLVGAAISMRLSSHPDLAYYLSIFSYMIWGCVYAFFEDVLAPLLRRMPVAVWLAGGSALLGVNFVALPASFMEFVYPAVAPLVICAIVFGTPLRFPPVRKIFIDPRLAYLGQISYTVYLWQQVATNDHGFASPLVAVLLISAVFGLAHLSYKYFEIPLVRIGRTLSTRRIIHALENSAAVVRENAKPLHSDQSLDRPNVDAPA